MRQMVLNHVSIAGSDPDHSLEWLKDMALGMKGLIDTGVSTLHKGLRMSNHGCAIYYALLYGESADRKNPDVREEIEFLAILGAAVPLLRENDDDLKDRLSRCQEKSLASEDGTPLLYCAFTEAIAVGFPSESIWDCDELTVTFDELLPEDAIEESSEIIDNLTRSSHASPIQERHMATQRQAISPHVFWNTKDTAFRMLEFIPEVSGQLFSLDSIAWSKVSKALNQMEIGNLSNVKGVGEGLLEFRIHFGPGYRIYFGDGGRTLVILRCGTKQHQNEDIMEARRLWRQLRRR